MGKVFQVAFDAKNPDGLAAFYAEALRYKFQDPPKGFNSRQDALKASGVPEEDWEITAAIVDPDGKGPRIFFQKMDTEKPGKNRLHLDLNLSEGTLVPMDQRKAQVWSEVDRLAKLGAKVQKDWEENGEFWVVMLDPEGNEFCVQ